MKPWVLIAGDFTPLGGMDRANHALAASLAASGDAEVHLVGHRVWPDLAGHSSVHVHRVRRPFGAHLLGAPRLASEGERIARPYRAEGRIVANGGNADTGDVTWVHYLHAAHAPRASGLRQRVQAPATHRYYLVRERRALSRARVIVCNSQRTSRDVREHLGIDSSRVRVVYYGSDAASFAPVTPAERMSARQALGWPLDRPMVVFIGALGDRRKGFDKLFEAWEHLCQDRAWEGELAVVGTGSELDTWRRRAAHARLDGRTRFLGFREDVPSILAASDLLVHPARYEAYGLGVHEAICRGVPAIVSGAAGIAELYPEDLRDLLITNVEDAREIADRIHRWRWVADATAVRLRPFSERLRSRSWREMSTEFVRVVES